jgi:hypothetical protein
MGLDAASGVPVAQKHVSMRAFGATEKDTTGPREEG